MRSGYWSKIASYFKFNYKISNIAFERIHVKKNLRISKKNKEILFPFNHSLLKTRELLKNNSSSNNTGQIFSNKTPALIAPENAWKSDADKHLDKYPTALLPTHIPQVNLTPTGNGLIKYSHTSNAWHIGGIQSQPAVREENQYIGWLHSIQPLHPKN